jgi:hypothetical protein
MGDLDASRPAETARRYNGLRWRYWRSFLGFSSLMGVVALIFSYKEELGPPLNLISGVLGILLGVGFVVCGRVASDTSWSLMSFRCPRCGYRFIQSWYGYWPTNRCHHCKLDLGPAAMATAKPAPELDL